MTTIIEKAPNISRRGMLAGMGGMTFCLALGTDGIRLLSEAEANTMANASITPWVRIAPDGTVTILSAGAEMGQGSMTSLAIILAEEMDADWSKVKVEFAPADADIFGYTFQNQKMMAIVGSRAVQLYYNNLRTAGAQVRKVLLANAAEKWGVDAASLRTEPGVVVNPANGQRLGYGEIAAFGKVPATLPPVEAKDLKARKDFRLIGKTIPRRDTPLKVNGTAQYAIDVRLPGMVYATALHSPVHTGTPEGWNDADIKKMPGVIATVRLGNGIAIVAQHFEQAMAARNALKATWNKGAAANFNSAQALEEYVKVHDDPKAQTTDIDKKGDANAAFAGAAKTYKAEFRSDYGYHAQMEPLNAVVRIADSGDTAEVWEGSQAPDASRREVAKALGLQPAQVTMHQCYMGGGFGRRSLGDYAAECARIAKEVRRPVKLVWTREEDIAHGMFRPQSFQCVEAATDAGGKVVGWRHCVVGDGAALLQTGIKPLYYAIPNQHIYRRGVSHGIRLKHWRAVGHVFNTFAIESLVDQMAADAGMDPIEFRYQRMSITPKAKKCFETVAEMSNWKAARPDGRALGITVTERSGSLGAGVVEISLDRSSGKIRVHKVWTAIDGGVIVTPGAARANVESAILYGLSSMLHERVTMKDGAVEQSNFHDYEVLRIDGMPKVEVHIVPSKEKPTGVGEPGVPPIAPAVANAIAAATGQRIRVLPFKKANVV